MTIKPTHTTGIEMKTSELKGPALDWAVAKADGREPIVTPFKNSRGNALYRSEWEQCEGIRWQPSTDWSQGGPLIERERIDVFSVRNGNGWCAQSDVRVYNGYGPTPLIAAMRCLVASKLGDTVQVPQELLP